MEFMTCQAQQFAYADATGWNHLLGYQDSAVTVLARIANLDGTAAQVSDIATITANIVDMNLQSSTGTPTVSVASTISDTLNTGESWSFDDVGFNFAFEIAGTNFPNASTYQIEITVTPVDGDPFVIVWVFEAQAL